jgi:hypothetical protein
MQTDFASKRATDRFPSHGWTGLTLLAVFWPLNWLLPDETMRTSYLFFPLWLGYILVVDALTLRRSGTSMLTRSRTAFWLQFAVSAPAWWLFEIINHRTQNWEYLGAQVFTNLEYYTLCTISFSTVMPAVFGTAELARTFGWVERFGRKRRVPATRRVFTGMFIAGLVMLTLTMLWPKVFYPLVWGAVFLLLEPINARLGRPTLVGSLAGGDWRPVMSLSVGALLCGFFWEMWNYWCYPKWVYHTPGAEFLYVFEMPLLGYLGYLPFAWELFAIRYFLWPKAPLLRL